MDIPIRGRIDRIDMKADSAGEMIDILDYKTGQVASEKDVLAGESIQLPFYALLAYHPKQKQVSQVEYVSIGKGEVKTKTTLESEALRNLSHQTGQRLVKIIGEIAGGEPLTAWGDKTTCERCQMSGICRKESWLVDNYSKREI
jgi:ATP-dependent helicase/nuclease subunit B